MKIAYATPTSTPLSVESPLKVTKIKSSQAFMEGPEGDSFLLTKEVIKEQRRGCNDFKRISRYLGECKQPDSPYAYFVCFCGFLCILIAIGCSYSYGLLFPVLLHEFKEGKAKTAWVGSLAYACGSLFGPVVGLLCDRFNHRTVGIAGGIISTMALLATSQAPNLTLMYFTFGVAFGFGNCCIFFVVLTIMPKYFIKRRSLATGLVLMGCGGGLIVMSPIIQALLTVSSWRITFIAMAGMLFVTCILSCSFDSKIGDNDKDSTDQDKQPNKLCPTLDFSYLRNKQFVIHLIGSITCFCGITVPLVHMAEYCQERGIDANRASMMYFWNGIVTVILRALTGSVCDRNKLYPRLIMQVAVFVAGATTILTTLTQSYTELLTCFVAYAVADGAIVTSMNILALAALSPKQRSQGFGFFHFCIAFALAVGPPFGGFLADFSGSYSLTFYVAGAFHVLAGCILLLSHCVSSPNVAQEHSKQLSPHEQCLIVDVVTVL